MAFLSAVPLRCMGTSLASAVDTRSNHRTLLMASARAEAMKNRIRTGAGVLGAAIALTLARTPTSADASPSPSPVLVQAAVQISTPSTSKISSNRGVFVAQTSLHDLTTVTESQPATAASTATGVQESKYDEGEFALSVRLCTACVIGVLMGGMSLKMREVVITSLTSCLATIYTVVPPGLESAAIASIAPSVVAPFFVGAGSLLFSLGYYALQKPASLKPSSSSLRRRLAVNAGLFASAAGAGSACPTGQALPAVAFYLLAMALCRDRTRRSSRKNLPRQPRRRTAPVPVREMVAYSPTSTTSPRDRKSVV